MNNLKKNWIIITAGVLVIIAFGMYVWNFRNYDISDNSAKWNDFGSYIGGIFSALAFLGVVYQLHTTKQEQKKQEFERTFFMMLEQHNLKLNTIGQEVIDEIYDKIISNYGSMDSLRNKIEIQEKSKIYSEVNSYFLLLYRILKFIYENGELNNKNNYSSLLRSFISNKLLVVLSYHLSNRDDSYRNYIEYINRFSFLEHVNFIDLELEFIHQVSRVEKEALYDLVFKGESYLFDALKSGELIPDDIDSYDREIFLKEIIQSKQENCPIIYKKFMGLNLGYVKEGKSVKAELKYEDNIIFHILKNFSLSAFGKNKEYGELIVRYKNIVNPDKE